MQTAREETIRVLLAEDDAVSRTLIARQLQSWGYLVDAYDNGTDAMMAIRKRGAPSVAIIDWEMPEMDGLEICRRVREGEWPVYIIMLTSHQDSNDLVAALETGAHDYLVKPCNPDELRARIKVGHRMIQLQISLAARVAELELATRRIRQLEGSVF